jgi:hypothetical protein
MSAEVKEGEDSCWGAWQLRRTLRAGLPGGAHLDWRVDAAGCVHLKDAAGAGLPWSVAAWLSRCMLPVLRRSIVREQHIDCRHLRIGKALVFHCSPSLQDAMIRLTQSHVCQPWWRTLAHLRTCTEGCSSRCTGSDRRRPSSGPASPAGGVPAPLSARSCDVAPMLLPPPPPPPAASRAAASPPPRWLRLLLAVGPAAPRGLGPPRRGEAVLEPPGLLPPPGLLGMLHVQMLE